MLLALVWKGYHGVYLIGRMKELLQRRGYRVGLATLWPDTDRSHLPPGSIQCDPVHILEACSVMALGLKAGEGQCLLGPFLTQGQGFPKISLGL